MLLSGYNVIPATELRHFQGTKTDLQDKELVSSSEAGHYLCEYIYFRSMVETITSHIPVLFCHVPFPGQPFILGEMTEFFFQLVGEMVDHREEFLHANLAGV